MIIDLRLKSCTMGQKWTINISGRSCQEKSGWERRRNKTSFYIERTQSFHYDLGSITETDGAEGKGKE